MASIVKPHSPVSLLEVLDLIGPVEAGADESITIDQRPAFAFGAIKKLGTVKTFEVTVTNGWPINGTRPVGCAFFARPWWARLVWGIEGHICALYLFFQG